MSGMTGAVVGHQQFMPFDGSLANKGGLHLAFGEGEGGL